MLNVAVPEIVLDQPGVRAQVGESKAAGMAQHVGMNGNGELGLLDVLVQQQVDGRAVQGLAPLTEEELPPWGFQAQALHQPSLGTPEVPLSRTVSPQRVAGHPIAVSVQVAVPLSQ